MKIIEPVVVAPLRLEWERIKAEIRKAEERRARARTPAERTRLLANARGLYAEFRTSLGRYRVLDPACGSGNFLALSLRALKDFDLSITEDAAAASLARQCASRPRRCGRRRLWLAGRHCGRRGAGALIGAEP
jgi:hypothetical protein